MGRQLQQQQQLHLGRLGVETGHAGPQQQQQQRQQQQLETEQLTVVEMQQQQQQQQLGFRLGVMPGG
jgi:hypothetical protein